MSAGKDSNSTRVPEGMAHLSGIPTASIGCRPPFANKEKILESVVSRQSRCVFKVSLSGISAISQALTQRNQAPHSSSADTSLQVADSRNGTPKNDHEEVSGFGKPCIDLLPLSGASER